METKYLEFAKELMNCLFDKDEKKVWRNKLIEN
jgi:hypothetical protein